MTLLSSSLKIFLLILSYLLCTDKKVNVVTNGVNVVQPRSQHCLSTTLALPWHRLWVSLLWAVVTLNDESVLKVLKTQLRYEIFNGLQLESTKKLFQFTRKQLLDNEMFNLVKVGMFFEVLSTTAHTALATANPNLRPITCKAKGKAALFANCRRSSSTLGSGKIKSDVFCSIRLVSRKYSQ